MKIAFSLIFLGLLCSQLVLAAFTPMIFNAKMGPNLVVSWIFQNGNINFLIEKSRKGHISFGLGSSMDAGDIFVIENDGITAVVKDCKLIGTVTPACNENQDWTIVDSQVTAKSMKVEVTRAAKTSDANDLEFTQSKNTVIYAYNDLSTLSDHNGGGVYFGTENLDFATGETGATGLVLGDGSWMSHEHTQVFLWVIVADILIPVGRYLRRYTRFFDYHSWPLLAVLILSAVFRNGASGDGPAKNSHKAYATVLIFLSIMIGFNGVVLRGVIEFDKIPLSIKWITYTRWAHLVIGIVCWIIARLCVITGCVLHKNKYGPLLFNLVIAETVIFIVAHIIFEFIRWRSFTYKPNSSRPDIKPSNDVKSMQILDDMKKGLTISDLKKKYPKENVFIHQSKVYNMGWYIHPGGQYFFDVCRWREVSRFIYGAVGLESMNNAAWNHSEAAMHALESHYVGDLLNFGVDGTEIVLRDQQGQVVSSTTNDDWYLNSRKTVSPTTAILYFKCKTLKVKLNCKGLHWLGRHFTISDGIKSRPYTNCTSLAEESATYRKEMVEYFELVKMDKGKRPEKLPELKEFIDYLPICVKQYEGKTALSKKLVSGDQGLQYTVEGPIGRSIEIPENFKGHVVLIGGGTGILPFLDLLEFILKKAIYSICRRDNIDTSFIHPQQDYDQYFPGAKFTLLSAFRTIDDFTGIECISDLYGICKKHGLDMFDALIRVKGLAIEHGLPTTQSHFTTEWLSTYINKRDDELFLISGPPLMQATLYKSLNKELNISDDRIIFV